MEVILQENYPSLGYVGDRVKVRPGYARNFLVPRGIAVEATSRNAKLLQHRVAAIQAKKLKLKNAAIEFGKKFEGLVLEFTIKLGEQGKSFGAISNKDIDASLKKQGIEIERKQIRIPEAIRTPGDHKAEVKLHAEVIVPLAIKVIQEKSAEKSADSAEGKKRRKGKEKSEQDAAAEVMSEEAAEAEAAE